MKKISTVLLSLATLTFSVSSYSDQSIDKHRARSFKGKSQQLIIQYDVNAPIKGRAIAEHFRSRTGEDIGYVREMSTPDRHVMRLGTRRSEAELEALKSALASDPSVISVEEDRRMYVAAFPNDDRFASQWSLFEPTGGIEARASWVKSTGQGTVIAIVDSGITQHSDLNANVLPGYDFISDVELSAVDGDGRDPDPSDPGDFMQPDECEPGFPSRFVPSSWHGTVVAGITSAVTNNGYGIAGIAHNARILPVRVLGKCGGLTSDIAEAIIWASGGSVPGVPNNPSPAQVINLSLGGFGPCTGTMQNAIDIARANGSTVVVAAGNANDESHLESPANCAGVLTVAANDREGNRASYSSFGRAVDVTAPGGENKVAGHGVVSTSNSGITTPVGETFRFYQGTSFATPQVSGVAALLYSVRGGRASPDKIEAAIKASARALPGDCPEGCGEGIVNANAALDAIQTIAIKTGGMTEKNLHLKVGKRKEMLLRTVKVPHGARSLTIKIEGGRGDADLFVRFGNAPIVNMETGEVVADCIAGVAGNLESCTFNAPQPGVYHIGILPFESFKNVKLEAEWQKF